MGSSMPLKFRCRACNHMRATEHISVRTIKQQIQGASVQANFNYCNDNNLCRSVAHAWYIKEAANVQMGKVVGCS